MIPASVARRIIARFERAVARRACAHAAGQSDHAITFEYRQAKGELLDLLQLLRTGENPGKSLEDQTYFNELLRRSQSDGMASSVIPNMNEPKTGNPR